MEEIILKYALLHLGFLIVGLLFLCKRKKKLTRKNWERYNHKNTID